MMRVSTIEKQRAAGFSPFFNEHICSIAYLVIFFFSRANLFIFGSSLRQDILRIQCKECSHSQHANEDFSRVVIFAKMSQYLPKLSLQRASGVVKVRVKLRFLAPSAGIAEIEQA